MLVSYTFDIEDKVKEKLEGLAEEGHRTLAGQIRMVLEEWLEKNASHKNSK